MFTTFKLRYCQHSVKNIIAKFKVRDVNNQILKSQLVTSLAVYILRRKIQMINSQLFLRDLLLFLFKG